MENIDLQASNLAAKIAVSDFKDPAKLQKFLEQFAAQYDSSNGGPSVQVSGANALLLGHARAPAESVAAFCKACKVFRSAGSSSGKNPAAPGISARCRCR
jgi:hypothetical protein